MLSSVIVEFEERPDSAIDYQFLPAGLHFLARDVERHTEIPAKPQGKFCGSVHANTKKLHEVLCESKVEFNFSSEGIYVRYDRRLKPDAVHTIVTKSLLAIGVKQVVLREKSSTP